MWSDHVLNPKLLTRIYPAQAPSLRQVRLHEVAIRCGSDLQCRLRFDLATFPLHAPAKWVRLQYNTVQVTLSFLSATIEHCAIPSGNGIGDLGISYEADRFLVDFQMPGHGSVFRAAATWVQIEQVAGYLNRPD
jgi:hypothetical protein